MPLDPQAQALIDQFNAQKMSPIELMSPREARMLMDVSTLALGPKPEVGKSEDVVIAGPGGDLRVRMGDGGFAHA
jgi:hypothetical protein